MTAESQKIQPRHLRRNAFLYVRQSSLRQVMENVESTKRQYALRRRAVALGWAAEQVVVIDSDLGQSGAATDREGFQKVVTEVGMGRAGIVMGLEVSRLARNSADWHRLLEICALTDTLILDEEGVYDPAHFNDRLLLGLKGTMSEAELHVIRARLRGGILNKARRGEFCMPLPIGLVYDDDDNVGLDPDKQVQQTLRYFFETFQRVGSAYALVRAFHAEGILFPNRPQSGPTRGELTFQRLSHSATIRALHNPRYAGAYAFGKSRSRKTVDGKIHTERLPREEWTVLIRDAHPGYITWDDFEANERRLKENDMHHGMAEIRSHPVREGAALLQGLVFCGRCGQRMSPHYRSDRGPGAYSYVCVQDKTRYSVPGCLTLTGRGIDAAISKLLTEVVTPMTLDATVSVQEELQVRLDQADQLRLQAVKRAQYQVDLARRRYMRVDPDNRFVADDLEAQWNTRLRELAEVREEYERQRKADRLVIDEEQRQRVLQLAQDFPRLWSDPGTSDRERKRMLRLLIEDVTLNRSGDQYIVQVRFRGGRTETLELQRPPNGREKTTTSAEVIAEIDRQLDRRTYAEIAADLNERGFKPGGVERYGNEAFTPRTVSRLARDWRLRSRYDRLRARGLLTRAEVMERLDISKSTLRNWAKHGIVVEHHCDGRSYLYEDPGPNPPRKALGRYNKLADRGRQATLARSTDGGAV